MKHVVLAGILLVGAALSLVACGHSKASTLENEGAAAQTETDKAQEAEQSGDVQLFSLKGTIAEIRYEAPTTPNPSALGISYTLADISYQLPCWATLEEGYPKADVDYLPQSKSFLIVFNGLARDNRVQGLVSCQGFATMVLKDVFVGPGLIDKSDISIESLEIRNDWINLPAQ